MLTEYHIKRACRYIFVLEDKPKPIDWILNTVAFA